MKPPYAIRAFNPKYQPWATDIGTAYDAAIQHWLAIQSGEVDEPVIIDGSGRDVTTRVFLHITESLENEDA